jgi:hypothetical protein
LYGRSSRLPLILPCHPSHDASATVAESSDHPAINLFFLQCKTVFEVSPFLQLSPAKVDSTRLPASSKIFRKAFSLHNSLAVFQGEILTTGLLLLGQLTD